MCVCSVKLRKLQVRNFNSCDYLFSAIRCMINPEVMAMKKEEIWGVAIDRARSFFCSQPDVSEAAWDAYTFRAVCITLDDLEPANNGIFSARRTRLVMEGPEEEVKVIHHRFFIQFLSAGG